jgi:hypothetical protein
MIDIKKNPETVGKLKVGTSSATPADGEVLANVVKSVDGDDYIKIDADTGQVAMYRTGNYIDFLKASSTFKIRGPGYTDFLTIDSNGNVTANGETTIEDFGSYRNLVLRRAQGTSASPTTIANTQTLGKLSFRGYTGSVYREGAAIAGKVSAHVGGDEIPSSLIFYTAADGATSPTVRLEIDNTGLASFSNGITIAGANNWSHITSPNDQSLSLADDSQIQLADVRAGAMLIHIYEQSAGHGAVIFATYFGQPELIAGSSTYFDVADTDGKICVIKSSSSHDVYLKNRRGSSKNFNVLVTAGVLDDF